MPQSFVRKDPRTFRLVKYLSQCPLEATAYGKCVAVAPERIEKDACAKEFQALMKCVNKVVEEMKVQRHKRCERRLSFYRNNFGLKSPYQLLIDGTICAAALQQQINVHEQCAKYLGLDVKLFTTNCVIEEMKRLGKVVDAARTVAQQFTRERCDHDSNKTSGTECLLSLAKRGFDNSPYIVCTTDAALSEEIRALVNTPLLYISHKTVVLEPPQPAAVTSAANKQSTKLHGDADSLEKLKLAVLGPAPEPTVKTKKRRGKKQPNPLSMKKRNTKDAAPATIEGKGKKTRRKRKSGVRVVEI